MRSAGTYQLVSEHSILSAQGKDRVVAAMEKFLEKTASHSKPERKEEILSDLEHDGSVYCPPLKLENRMDAVEKKIAGMETVLAELCVGVKALLAESKMKKKNRERGNEGGHVDEIGDDRNPPWKQVTLEASRAQEESENGNGGIKSEKLKVNSQFQKLDVDSNHQNQKNEEESEIEKAGKREGGSINEPVSVFAKPEKGDGGDAKPPPKMLEGRATTEVVVQDHELQEGVLSLVTGSGEGEKVGEMARRSDEKLRNDEHWGRPPGENAGGASATGGGAMVSDEGVDMAELKRARELGFCLGDAPCDKEERKMKEVSADGLPGNVDLVALTLGQAQSLIVTPPQFTNNRGVLQGKIEMEKKWFGFGWLKRKGNFTSNPMGQTHNFIIAPPIFANSGGVLQVENEMDTKELVGFGWDQTPNLSMTFEAGASVFGFVGAPKIDVDVSAIVVSFNREATILYDPRGCLSSSCITWLSCFKLWDPGRRPIMTIFLISSP